MIELLHLLTGCSTSCLNKFITHVGYFLKTPCFTIIISCWSSIVPLKSQADYLLDEIRKKKAESYPWAFSSILFHSTWLRTACMCLCGCEVTRGTSPSTQICAFPCLSFPLWLLLCHTSVIWWLRLCVRSLCTVLGWDATLITTDGCYEISLPSSFVPVSPVLVFTPELVCSLFICT